MNTKHFPVEITKSANPDFDATFVMSATAPDRVHDTIDKSAYTPNLGKKLIALWQHNQDQPMGYWENLRVEGTKLIGDLKVASTNLGLMIKQLIADGVPLGASIGFSGKGSPNSKGGIHFKEINLMECSVVSVPAHPLAMQIAKSFDLEEFIDLDASNVQADDEAASGRCAEEIIRKSKAATLVVMKSIRK